MSELNSDSESASYFTGSESESELGSGTEQVINSLNYDKFALFWYTVKNRTFFSYFLFDE